MIKYILTIWVCSFLEGQVCMPPIHSPIVYNSWYECSRASHEESLKIMATHSWGDQQGAPTFKFDAMRQGWYLNDGRGTIQGHYCNS